MKLKLESTEQLGEVNGAPVRVWRGRTGKGVEVLAYIAAIRAPGDEDLAELEAELLEVPPPSGVCRECGCTDEAACPGGCSWADEGHTLCSECA